MTTKQGRLAQGPIYLPTSLYYPLVQIRVSNPGFPEPENPGFRAFPEPENPGFRAFLETRKPRFFSIQTGGFGKRRFWLYFQRNGHFLPENGIQTCSYFITLHVWKMIWYIFIP